MPNDDDILILVGQEKEPGFRFSGRVKGMNLQILPGDVFKGGLMGGRQDNRRGNTGL
jgi:hypothetical protein